MTNIFLYTGLFIYVRNKSNNSQNCSILTWHCVIVSYSYTLLSGTTWLEPERWTLRHQLLLLSNRCQGFLHKGKSRKMVKNNQWNYTSVTHLWYNQFGFIFCAIDRRSMKNTIYLYRQPLVVSIETSFQSYPINYERSITYRSITNTAFHFYLYLKVTWIYDFHGYI